MYYFPAFDAMIPQRERGFGISHESLRLRVAVALRPPWPRGLSLFLHYCPTYEGARKEGGLYSEQVTCLYGNFVLRTPYALYAYLCR